MALTNKQFSLETNNQNDSEIGEVVRIQPFRNGHMTIQNVPYVQCKESCRARLTPSTLKDIARLTRFMQESGVHEFDLREFRNSSLYAMPYA